MSLSVDGQPEIQLTLPAGEEIEGDTYFFHKNDVLSATAMYVGEPSSEVSLSTRLTFAEPFTYFIELSEAPTGLRLSCNDADVDTEGCPQP